MAYEKQTWHTGDVITEGKLNHMEDGIFNANRIDVLDEDDFYSWGNYPTELTGGEIIPLPKKMPIFVWLPDYEEWASMTNDGFNGVLYKSLSANSLLYLYTNTYSQESDDYEGIMEWQRDTELYGLFGTHLILEPYQTEAPDTSSWESNDLAGVYITSIPNNYQLYRLGTSTSPYKTIVFPKVEGLEWQFLYPPEFNPFN